VCGLSATLRVVCNLSNVGRRLKAEPCVSLLFLLLLLTRFTFRAKHAPRFRYVTLPLAVAIGIGIALPLAVAYIETCGFSSLIVIEGNPPKT